MRPIAALGTALVVLVCVCPPAQAACTWTKSEQMLSGVIRIKWELVCSGSSEPATTTDAATPPRDSDWDRVCVRLAQEIGADLQDYCDLPEEPSSQPPRLTPGTVATAFRELPLPPADLIIQPPDGRTLVNFDTNFYTDQGEIPRSLTMLGRQVDLRIWPASFHWNFGDGEVLDSTSPGAPYPDLEITHSYRDKGTVQPSVDVTYAAQFRVDGGPWQDVPGTVTIPGSPQELRVVTARPVLVGG